MTTIFRPGAKTDNPAKVAEGDLLAIVENEGALYRPREEGDGRIRLWDNVEQGWTKPLGKVNAYEQYLRKVVLKCSACTYTTIFNGGVTGHVKATLEGAQAHRGAQAIHSQDGSARVVTCTGCGTVFRSRLNQGQIHINDVQAAERPHRGAVEVPMLRFSLAPVALPETNGHKGGPEASQAVRMPVYGKRKRSRGRKRSRSRGNNHAD